MAYPLIIFGAGASFDYSPLGKVAPLTNHLTNDDFLMDDLLEEYKGANDILSDVIHQVRFNNKNFEEVLTEMKERTKQSARMRANFAALEFYLKALFGRISGSPSSGSIANRVRQINNYRAIINRINTYSEGKACVVTFNYDTLFENSLTSNVPQKIKDYVTNDLKIIKLHGSHDWGYIQSREKLDMEIYGLKNSFEWCLENPDFLDKLKNSTTAHPYHMKEVEGNSRSSEVIWFPAIAVPLVGKDQYVCPPAHIQALERILPSVDRVLVVGWKAGDLALLETLKKHLPQMGYKVLVVSNTLEGAKEIKRVIIKGLGINNANTIEVRGGGFSDLIKDEISHTFFSD